MWTQGAYRALLVDDSADDRLFFRKAMEGLPFFKLVAELENGREALAYLQGNPPWHDRDKHPIPDLLFLDLKMPLLDGFGVLQWLRANPSEGLSIVVLSGSFLDSDINQCRDLGINNYFVKSSSIETIREMLQEIELAVERRAALVAGVHC